MQQHKVEILLPLTYNNKKPIEGKKYVDTYKQILNQFNGCTQDKTSLIGGWKDPKTNKKYKDINICYWVICVDSIDNTHFLEKLKDRLKIRFEQDEIMMIIQR